MRYLIAAVCSLAIHAAATIWWQPYGDLVLAAGSSVVPGNDVSDLADVMLVGFLMTAPAALAIGSLIVRRFRAG